MPDEIAAEEINDLDLGNSEDDIEVFIRNLLAEDTNDEGTEEVVDESTQDDGTSTETPPIEANWQWDDGLTIDREKARNLALFDAWLESNPQLASQIAGVARGEFELVSKGGRGVQPDAMTPTLPPTPASPPEELDLDDPVIKRLWGELQTNRQQLDAASQIITRHEAQITQSTQSTTRALVDRVANEYAEKHGLTTDELSQVRQRAAYLLPQFSAPIDISTGLPRNVDPVYAVEESLNAAYWSIPEFRSKALNEMTRTKVEDIRKKSKLNSLGGTSGSVPRKTPKPANDNERREAMIAEVAAVWNGNGN